MTSASWMMICPKCNSPIILGRVFCNHCGAKLDLTGMSREMIPGKAHRWAPLILKTVVPLAILLAVVCAALALWPRTETIGKAGTRMGARRAESQLATVRELGAGQTLTVWLNEEDVNGYFEFFGDSRMRLRTFRVVTHRGYCVVRAIRQLDPLEMGRVRIVLTLSLDMACVPVGNRLAPRRGSLGHLPLPRFLLGRFGRGLEDRFDAWPELELFRFATGVSVQDGRFEVAFKK